MAKEVHETIIEIASLGVDDQESSKIKGKELVSQWMQEKRYIRDIWA
jgi:sulfite reductase alpha subunit-like flavoprotein